MEHAQFLPIGKAAEVVGVPRPRLAALVRRGELPSYRSAFDRRLRLVARADLERLRAPQAVAKLVA